MSRYEGLINNGSGDQGFEINRTQQEFAGVSLAIEGVLERHRQRAQNSIERALERAAAGLEIRETVKTYAHSVRDELAQSAHGRGVNVRTNSVGNGFGFYPESWSILFHGGQKEVDADAPFLVDEIWFPYGGRIAEEIGNTLMMLRAHANAPLTRSGGK